jgi:hypothetical protein
MLSGESDDDVVSAVGTWLHQEDKEWYQLGLHMRSFRAGTKLQNCVESS